MSTQDALPRWLRTLFIAINDAPWTNLKSMNTEILTYGTAFFLVVAAVKQVTIEENILYAWLAFLLGKVTASVAGSGIKRATFKPSPPNTQDVEDAAATTATPSPIPLPVGKPHPKTSPAIVSALETAAKAPSD